MISAIVALSFARATVSVCLRANAPARSAASAAREAASVVAFGKLRGQRLLWIEAIRVPARAVPRSRCRKRSPNAP
jgi:hypothetical protein